MFVSTGEGHESVVLDANDAHEVSASSYGGISNAPPQTIGQTQSSRVKRFVRRRMAGAANSTIGSIMIQATNDDRNQWITKVPVAMKGKLAIAAAIVQVRPD